MNKRTKALLTFGPIGSLLFIIVFLIEGVLRNDYSSLLFPISSLAIGEWGWIQICNFIISGSFIIVFAFGLHQTLSPSKDSLWISGLIATVGFGLIGAGIFSTDPLFGYPATAPLAFAQYTTHGHLHNFFSIFVFVCLPSVCFRFRKRFNVANEYAMAKYSLFSGLGILIAFFLSAVGFNRIWGLTDIAGLLQRLSVIIGFCWIAVIGLHFIRKQKQ
jgi:hypothetical protein